MKQLSDIELYDLMSNFVFEAHDDTESDGEIRLFIRGFDYYNFIRTIPIDSERPLKCYIVSDGDICIFLSGFEHIIEDYDSFEKIIKKNLCEK